MIPIQVTQRCPAPASYRAARVPSLFNVTADTGSSFALAANLPLDEQGWRIGLVVGPSGSGKSSIGRACAGFRFHQGYEWGGGPVIDEISPGGAFDDVTAALSAVGLGSVPSWLRPFGVLSTGERFRAEMARVLLEDSGDLVFDEFTSVVDRQVARIGAMAFAKAWRRGRPRRIILLSCHRDIVEWLQPDWTFDTEDMSLQRGCLRRPPIEVEVHETNWKPWKTFEPHHYLKIPHMIAATNYVALHDGEPVAHLAVGTNTGLVSARMCRLVVMPEWQGAGIGTRFMDHVAERWLRGKNRYGRPMTTIFHTSHPGLCAALRRNRSWMYVRGRVLGEDGAKSHRTLAASRGGKAMSRYGGHLRAVSSFRYVGADK
jgi:GNAT superfamily N-acetyltransferase